MLGRAGAAADTGGGWDFIIGAARSLLLSPAVAVCQRRESCPWAAAGSDCVYIEEMFGPLLVGGRFLPCGVRSLWLSCFTSVLACGWRVVGVAHMRGTQTIETMSGAGHLAHGLISAGGGGGATAGRRRSGCVRRPPPRRSSSDLPVGGAPGG